MGVPELLGATAATVGALLALWCIFTFVFVGRGTPAPFDPPRRLVVRGPYRLSVIRCASAPDLFWRVQPSSIAR